MADCVRKRKYDALKKLFDITKVEGLWLSLKDKRLHHLQYTSQQEINSSFQYTKIVS